ncbi:MAG TPA: transposase [Candidatus Elarobacter sp.]|jgi:hypothetical protein|nr:transposase [Candidatus Elarobacter sp.]
MSSKDDIRPDVAPEPEAASAASTPGESPIRERGVYTNIQRQGADLANQEGVEAQGGGVWTVGDCIVNFPRKEGTCKAFRKSTPRTRCIHWWAVAYTIEPPTPDEFVQPKAPEAPVAAPLPPPISVIQTLPSEDELRRIAREKVRGGYKRDAKGYDEHLRGEFADTMFFLRALLPQVGPLLDSRAQGKRGPKITPLSELLFSALIHAHMNWSFRRTEGMVSFLAHPRIGLAPEKYPGFAYMGQFVRDPSTTPILRDLLALTFDPFREYGPMTIAGDGTGASSNRFDDWMVEGKHYIESRGSRRWYKAHAVMDVDTFGILAVYVTDKDVSEKRVILSHIIPELVAREYDVEKFLLDGGYNATEIRDVIATDLGAVPFVPWGANSKNAISLPWRHKVKNAALINEIYKAFKTDEGKEFKAEYRYRVKVENLFSSIKTRYGGSVRAQDGNGPENEILLKCICHNVHMLLLAAKVYGLDLSAMGGEEAA